MRDDLEKSVIINGFRTCGLYPFCPDNVSYDKCVLDTHRSTHSTKTDPRHEYLENLLGSEMVASFNEDAERMKDSPYFKLWLKSKEVCFNVSNPENMPRLNMEQPLSTENSYEPVDYLGENITEEPLSAENSYEPVGLSFEEIENLHSNNIEENDPLKQVEPAGEETRPVSTAKKNEELAKVLSPETDGKGVPSPLKRALYWPGTPKKTNKARRSLYGGYPVLTSEQFREVKTKEKQKKIELEKLKEEKKQKRKEAKDKKEAEKRAALEKKSEMQRPETSKKAKKMKIVSSSSSESSVDVSSGESEWNEVENDDEEVHLQPAKKEIGEHVIVRYDGKHFPGIILDCSDTCAKVSAMVACGRLWKWPERADVCDYKWEAVLGHIAEPTKVSKTRNVFSVSEMEFDF